MERRRFCFVMGGYFDQVRGGAEYQAYLLAKRLVELGHEVHYIHADRGDEFERTIAVKLHSIPRGYIGKRLPRYAFMWDAPKVASTLKEIRPDIVYQRGAHAYTWIAGEFARAAGKCLVWHIANETDVIPVQSSWRNIVFGRYLEKHLIIRGIKRADVIVAQAEYQARLLMENYGVRVGGIVPNFHPATKEISEKETETINVLWAANLKARKQPLVFVELAEALRDRHNVRFIMVGRSSPGIARVVRDKENALGNLHYLGEVSQDEVNRLMEKAHIFVNTSTIEGFPNTFIQAWLRNVPVISLRVNPDEVLTREGIGLCSGSIEQLIRDCRTLIEDPERRSMMGECARAYATEVHSVDRNVDKMLELIAAWEEKGKRAGLCGSSLSRG